MLQTQNKILCTFEKHVIIWRNYYTILLKAGWKIICGYVCRYVYFIYVYFDSNFV